MGGWEGYDSVNEGARPRGRGRNDWKEAMAKGGFVHDGWGGWQEGGAGTG